ncbi:hypothetical protein IE077_001035 [Cardiosporidium cionae]|uniref:Uncharacterized protein n=1 Tax=Cardiosporidium cionae TaxID=476202 RepID=A0ABQ7J612_9APIC|nr:hypothetical protein IE077_001035 [Cardiosporidium cionae]|eukprot:KAF8819432.1 hypothetical protein IE077_001035 [Cardiosporidium cionae]
MVPSDMVKLEGKALQKIQMASPMWEKEDRFCNPGPIQFFGHALYFYSRYLFEQQHEYLRMLSEISAHLSYLSKTCTFGIDERSLRISCISLHMLREILSNPKDGEAGLSRRRSDDDYTRRMSGFIPL